MSLSLAGYHLRSHHACMAHFAVLSATIQARYESNMRVSSPLPPKQRADELKIDVPGLFAFLQRVIEQAPAPAQATMNLADELVRTSLCAFDSAVSAC